MGDMTATDKYRVLLSGGEGEIVEKKSRFISTIRKCETEEEAVAFIEEMKKKILGCQTQLFCIYNRKQRRTDPVQR